MELPGVGQGLHPFPQEVGALTTNKPLREEGGSTEHKIRSSTEISWLIPVGVP